MPSLIIVKHGSPIRTMALRKHVVSLGSGANCDIVVSGLADLEANFVQTPSGWAIHPFSAQPVLCLASKRIRKETPLDDGTILTAPHLSLVFSLADLDSTHQPHRLTDDRFFERLRIFTDELAKDFTLDRLFDRLLDGLISLCGADRGFLLLKEDERYRVKVARNLEEKISARPEHLLSDTIVRTVLERGEALLVSNAPTDTRFSASQSVIDLQLLSVLAVPLLMKGEVLGVIYLGIHRIGHEFDQRSLAWASVFAAQAALLLTNLLAIRQLDEQLAARKLGEMLGSCPGISEVFRKIERVAKVDVDVLVTGETGTGKELVAREIHRLSGRTGRFVSINCGAIPESLIESELFGHVKGAFTGAIRDRGGCFQAAHAGTLFLDEIGELALPLQVKLLRVLQEKTVTKVGSDIPEEVDVRIVAATNRDLKAEAAAGRFREDLLYRLNVVPIEVPPLRERGDDILLLAKYFFSRYREEFKSPATGFSRAALLAMRAYAWPGNIRELENRIKRALVLAEGLELTPADLGLQEPGQPILSLAEAKERFQADYIDRVLALNGGNRTKTAADLGVDPRTIYRHLAKKRGLSEAELMKEEGVVETS